MKLPLEMGRAGLGLIMFVFVLAAMILYFGKPAAGSGPFVITVIMLVGAALACTLLMIVLKLQARTSKERKHHD